MTYHYRFLRITLLPVMIGAMFTVLLGYIGTIVYLHTYGSIIYRIVLLYCFPVCVMWLTWRGYRRWRNWRNHTGEGAFFIIDSQGITFQTKQMGRKQILFNQIKYLDEQYGDCRGRLCRAILTIGYHLPHETDADPIHRITFNLLDIAPKDAKWIIFQAKRKDILALPERIWAGIDALGLRAQVETRKTRQAEQDHQWLEREKQRTREWLAQYKK